MRPEYLALIRQVRLLSRTLLPPVSPTARYSGSEILQMLAFRLSAHAEVESFLEDCASHLADHYATLNNQNKLSSRVRRLLLHHSGMRDQYPPRSLTAPLPTNVGRKITGILNAQIDAIEGNNGLSQKDILKLFVPLGVEISFFNTAWLDSMDRFARSRGDVAHKSWLNPSRQPEPREERRLLVAPLLGLRDLIEEVARLRALA
jgi:HEPN superfamily RiboL-PSP-like protein